MDRGEIWTRSNRQRNFSSQALCVVAIELARSVEGGAVDKIGLTRIHLSLTMPDKLTRPGGGLHGVRLRRISASQRTTYTKMKTLESPVHDLARGGSNGSSEWYLCNEALSCPVSRGEEGGETLILTVDQILTTARIGLLMAPIPRFPALGRGGWCTCCLLVSSGRSGVVVVVVGECSSV